MNNSISNLIKEFKLSAVRSSEYRIKGSNKSIIFYFSPGNLTSTSNTKPYICAYLKHGGEFLDLKTLKVYVDDEKLEFYLKGNLISCIPKTLNYGTHTVKLIISGKNSEAQEFSWSFLIEDELLEYNFYYGIPHAHTSYSDGAGIPTEAYNQARESGLNFLIVTDHQGKLAKGRCNYTKDTIIYGKSSPKWEMLKLESQRINSRYKNFTALFGYELSTDFWGHINIINSKNIIQRKPSSLDELYSYLIAEDDILISVNHPNRSPRTLPFTHNFDNFVNLYEVGNGSTTRVYTRTEQNYYRALDDGWHIAAINGQDNHIDDWGQSPNVTAVIAKELSKASLINAIKLRRVYSTESRSLKLVVKGNNQWMGSILNLKPKDELNLYIEAYDENYPIEKIQVITNKGRMIEEKCFEGLNKVEWNLILDVEEDYNYYVVKVVQSGGKVALSSALFVQNLNAENL